MYGREKRVLLREYLEQGVLPQSSVGGCRVTRLCARV